MTRVSGVEMLSWVEKRRKISLGRVRGEGERWRARGMGWDSSKPAACSRGRERHHMLKNRQFSSKESKTFGDGREL